MPWDQTALNVRLRLVLSFEAYDTDVMTSLQQNFALRFVVAALHAT
jgi:hypothetical protein